MYHLRAFLVVLCLAGIQNATGSVLDVYVQAPGTPTTGQTAGITGQTGITNADIETANFDSQATGTTTTSFTSNIGTFNSGALDTHFGITTSSLDVAAADEYGGAGGTGHYIAIGAETGTSNPVTVSLNASTNYLGLWWSAADTNNSLELFNNGTLVATVTSAEMQALLPDNTTSTVKALNGSTYHTNLYYGNPNTAFSGQDSNEPFFYVDLVLNGATFNQVAILNNGTAGTGFETDNWSIYDGGTVTTSEIPTTDVFVVPEPRQYAALCCGIIFGLVAGHRLLKKLRAPSLAARPLA